MGTTSPALENPLVEFVGEITDREKGEFLGDAAAQLFPFDWPEPFGLVIIESMACGTPVIAYGRGTVPEIIEHGVTGFICENLDEMVAAIDRLPLIQRRQCRDAFEARFTVQREHPETISPCINGWPRLCDPWPTSMVNHPC